MSAFLAGLRVRAAEEPRRLVLPEGGDPRVTEAAAILARDGLARPVLLAVGEEADAARTVLGAGSGVLVVDPVEDSRRTALAQAWLEFRAGRGLDPESAFARTADPLVFAGLLVRTGEADGCVAGAVSTTPDVLRAALSCIGLAPGIRTLSSSFYMVLGSFRMPEGEEVLNFTDAGVVPDPDSVQLAEIAQAAVEARRRVVGDTARVAFLSYATKGSAQGPGVRKVEEAVEVFRSRLPDIPADGPLQVDAALVPAVAQRKAPDSVIAGDANVLVFPDLNAGNIGYKLVQRLAGAEAIGPILQGLAHPCNDLSRGASVADIVNAACITALQA